MAALLKKTIEKGSDALSGRNKQKNKNVIAYQEFTHEEEEEEETKEYGEDPSDWKRLSVSEEGAGFYGDDDVT